MILIKIICFRFNFEHIKYSSHPFVHRRKYCSMTGMQKSVTLPYRQRAPSGLIGQPTGPRPPGWTLHGLPFLGQRRDSLHSSSLTTNTEQGGILCIKRGPVAPVHLLFNQYLRRQVDARVLKKITILHTFFLFIIKPFLDNCQYMLTSS